MIQTFESHTLIRLPSCTSITGITIQRITTRNRPSVYLITNIPETVVAIPNITPTTNPRRLIRICDQSHLSLWIFPSSGRFSDGLGTSPGRPTGTIAIGRIYRGSPKASLT